MGAIFRDNYPAEYDSMIIMLLTHTKQVFYRRFAALSRFLRPATWVWYNAVSLRLLQVAVLRGYSEGRYFAATVTGATVHAVVTEYHQSTVKDTPTCRGHIGTALYKSYIAGQEDSGCVITHTMEKKLIFLLSTHAQSFQYPYQPVRCGLVGSGVTPMGSGWANPRAPWLKGHPSLRITAMSKLGCA